MATSNSQGNDNNESTFIATLKIKSNCNINTSIFLFPCGCNWKEKSSKYFIINSNIYRNITIQNRCKLNHRNVTLQIEISKLNQEYSWKVISTVKDIGIYETLDSVLGRLKLKKEEINLRIANQLFQNKDFYAALALYQLLYEKYKLSMYAYNAISSFKMIGMSWVEDISLLQF